MVLFCSGYWYRRADTRNPKHFNSHTLFEVGKITSCSPVGYVLGTYLLKLCWYWFCIGHFFLWHLLLVLLHYFLHSPIQSRDSHFNIIGLIFPFSTRETNSQSNAGLQRNPVTLFTTYLAKKTKRFSTLPSFHGKYTQYRNLEKKHLCYQNI